MNFADRKDQQLFHPDAQMIERLMGEHGENMLDEQILKIRDQMGSSQFDQFAQQFFRNTNIDYKTFFTKGNPLQFEAKTQSKQNMVGEHEQQIRQNGEIGVAAEDEEVVMVGTQIEEYTNNSQAFENEYEEIEKTNIEANKFRIKYKNGDIYEGEIENQEKNGWGEYFYQTGQRYCGCFIDDEINGYGRYYFLSGAEYEGDWSSGMKHGVGVLKFSNGDQYEGKFSHDDLHGNGVYHYKNGDVFRGVWSKGLRNGNGIFEGIDGRIQKGLWVNDKFEV